MVTKGKKLKILCIVFFLVVVFLVGAMKILAIDSPGTGYAVPNGADNYAIQYLQVGETYARCGYVDNNTGQALFIGTKTSAEWSSFKAYEPSGAYGCDAGSNANAGVTAYFTSTVCGSWDWNCDGLITKENTNLGWARSPCYFNWDCNSGWMKVEPVACGVTWTYFNGICRLFEFYCDWYQRTQSCH